ncbi:hypothetical protein Tco_0215191, partial [Tanacetum coccineum]
ALMDSEKQQSAILQKKYAKSQECIEERLRKLEDSENKVQQLQDSLSRLEEKLQNLESENKVFRQQAVSMTVKKKVAMKKNHGRGFILDSFKWKEKKTKEDYYLVSQVERLFGPLSWELPNSKICKRTFGSVDSMS